MTEKSLPEGNQNITELAIREKYIIAMLCSLGVREETAKQKAKSLLQNASIYANIDYSKDRRDLTVPEVDTITAVGSDLLVNTVA